MRKSWYWIGTIDSFEGIFYGEEIEAPSDHGFFNTFEEAKRDAKEYYQTTIDYAKDCKRRVNETRKGKL